MRLAPLVLAVVLLAAACGGDDRPVEIRELGTAPLEEGGPASLPGWVADSLREGQGVDSALVFATSDFAVGENRLTFLLVQPNGELVQAPEAPVVIGREGSDERATARATLVPLPPHTHDGETLPSHDHPDVTDLYLTHFRASRPGRYWIVVEPPGAGIQGFGFVDVRERTVTPPVGSEAIPSDNPTLDDAPAEEISTASEPHLELLRHSIADSLEARVPFVAAFATPRYCQTRACGPTVDVVDEVRRRIGDPGVRYIHVEIYEGNDPANGVNRWVREWSLPTEPWVFVVDETGVVRAKFEGNVTVDELEAAVREHLL